MGTKRQIDPEELANAASGEKPTLKTISRLSGLAVPTVSRALNDAPDIGKDTKIFVRSIADAIGYVPNRAGVRLRTGRTNVISLVLSTDHDMMNHTARLISSLASTLRNTPFHLIVTPCFPDEDVLKPIRYIVETKSADAVIFNQIRPDDPRVSYLMEKGFPFATHGRSQWSEQHAYADYDNVTFGRIGVQRLKEKGRKNIVLVAPPEEHNYSQEMRRGCKEACEDFGLKLLMTEKVTSDTPIRDTQSYLAQLFKDDPDIDGVICGSSNASLATAAAAEENGYVIGSDIDIIGKEAIPFLKLFRSELLVLKEDINSVGEFLAEAAIQAIRNPDAPPMHLLDVPKLSDFGD